MKHALSPKETADLIDRFLEGREAYPQEWNDFIEARKVEPQVEQYREQCYELDPLVNTPGTPDAVALSELERISKVLREM